MANSKWFQDSVVYQIYPQSFQDSNHDGIGDLNGITQRLDYLQKLGVDVLWLNPIYQSPCKDNGYDIADYKAINPQYGTMADFDHLLAETHRHGMKLLMDLVVNHTSNQNAWFQESKSSRDNPYADYYIWRDPVDGHEPNNWGAAFGGSAWTYVPERGQYYLHLFAPGQPDLNWENPDVRNAVWDIMRFWLDKGVNGFRMDVINLISKPAGLPDAPAPANYATVEKMVADGPKLNDYLHEMNREVLSHYDVMTVGEMPSSTPEDAVKYTGLNSHELNMVFQFQHVTLSPNPDKHLAKWNDQPVKLTELKQALGRWQKALDGKGWNSLYWNNHDQPRAVSRFGDDRPEYRVRSAKALGTTLHMLQGTPYVYEGEELGMPNAHYSQLSQYEDLESINFYHELVEQKKLVDGPTMLKYLAHMSRDNARTPMPWDATTNAGFTDGTPWFALNPTYPTINAQAALADPDSIFYYYQKLIKLRHQTPIIRYGTYQEVDPDDEAVFTFRRHYQGQTLLVMTNFTDQSVERDYGQAQATQRLIGNYADDQGTTLRPYESKVYLFD
ncbi:oligo-1,6-glucosidase [Levilactobacillus namurensis DSM 19117]|uniref:Oligo-1,6-glucosidase n=1 Tax=Levilactobacillus namurensis DSM 19117 TaxID=1423773 RepID=A0A0R1JTU9_9LACO|nr:alpha-glucosidase [Levilactobacillus namurensis]KRK74492.1 oligo-1,6-glucosidase [Levilactobacillus namurensis DSM 19117]GEO74266.1 glucohydrolase [Levilactobacillus namurensis]